MNPGKSIVLGIIGFGIVISLLSSCVTQRKVEYFQDENDSIKLFHEAGFPDYKLQPNDELYIQINSLDEGYAGYFSTSVNNSTLGGGAISPYGASLMSYSIDSEGNLFLPLIGKISTRNRTLKEVSQVIRDSLANILNQPIVTIKLVNRYVSVLGEVRNPGHFAYAQEKLTVYDAIALAGDVTDYGNKNNVILLRNENRENARINLDLTKSEILNSSYYNLRPNDIIYVKPLKRRFWGMREFPFSVVFSTLTTGLLIYNIFR